VIVAARRTTNQLTGQPEANQWRDLIGWCLPADAGTPLASTR
jgi:hypothetical protein